jgi:hypothetical protein
VDGKLNGEGRYKTANERYGGMFKDDLEHGIGRIEYANGSYYQGAWKEGKPHGLGLSYIADKNMTYEGEFENGERCGRGKEQIGEQQVRDGLWRKN